MKILLHLFLLFCLLTPVFADDEIFRIGGDVTAPRILSKKEPEYSNAARADHIQGTVVLEIVITEEGRVTGVTTISPLGFGLDERARAAVEKR